MNDALVEKYKEYANSEESFSILFVKKYLRAAKNKWIAINDCEVGWHNEITKLEFKYVHCELFEKKRKPKYPPKKFFDSEEDYILACRAVTWKTANKDIDEQRAKNIHGSEYTLRGIRLKIENKNYNTNKFFRDDAPEEIKALEKNLNDRTNPLWDIAINFMNRGKPYFYEYKFIVVIFWNNFCKKKII